MQDALATFRVMLLIGAAVIGIDLLIREGRGEQLQETAVARVYTYYPPIGV